MKKSNGIIKNGQHNLPSWEKFNEMVDGIWDRKYYTNHGPLVQELENRLASFCKVKHVIGMTNSHIALMISAKALNVQREVLVPSFSHISLSQSVIWAGAKPVFCDIEENNPHIDTNKLTSALTNDTSAIFSTNLLGGFSDMDKINQIASEKELKSLHYSEDAFGESYKGLSCAAYSDVTVFSFHETNIVNGADAACVCTNDDEIAARIRNIRSSYGSGPKVPIPFTGNGRMSEIQAGLILLSLEEIKINIKRNQANLNLYSDFIHNISGINLFQIDSKNVDNNNYQNIILEVNEREFGINAIDLSKALQNKGIEALDFSTYGINPIAPFNVIPNMPNTEKYRKTLLRLPNNKSISEPEINLIGSILMELSKN